MESHWFTASARFTPEVEKVGRGYLYRPAADVDDRTAAAMRKVLDSGQDRAAVLRRFLGGLDAADEALLTELLGEGGGGSAAGRRSPGLG